MTDVRFDIPKRERLRERYNQAVERGEETFTFEGGEWLRDYAKYVLQFLDNELGEAP